MAVNCDYCGKQAYLVGGKVIYPHRQDLYSKHFYNCEQCKAFVGCHPNTINPLGRLANAELRTAKIAAHSAFDPMWKEGELSRASAYKWLAQALNINASKCHIGMMDVDTCNRVVMACMTEPNAQQPMKVSEL